MLELITTDNINIFDLNPQELEELIISSEDDELWHLAYLKLKASKKRKPIKQVRQYLKEKNIYYKVRYYYFFKFLSHYSAITIRNGRMYRNNRGKYMPPFKMTYEVWKTDRRYKLDKYLHEGDTYAIDQHGGGFARSKDCWMPYLLIVKDKERYKFAMYDQHY